MLLTIQLFMYCHNCNDFAGVDPVPVVGMNFKNIENILPVNNEM